MSLFDAYRAAWLKWAEAASQRWSNASQKIKDGTYEPKHLMSDALATWVTDPITWWQDMAYESGGAAASVLINVPVATPTGDSAEFYVPNADQAQVTPLVRLGGNEEIPNGGAGPRVGITKKSDTSIVISLANLTNAIPAGRYVGFVYEGSKLLAHVIALR
jgi:hypothetical protein